MMNKRIWLITGVSSGLGKALAECVMDTGDYVVATFRNASQVVDFNDRHGASGKGILLDVTELDRVASAVDQLVSELGRIDVLVNNAGIGFIGAIEEASIDEVRAIFEPNVYGALKLTQAVLPHMRSKGSGHIIQISSHAGIKAFAGFGVYNASKFALEGFSEALAQEVQPLGIKVTIVEPGPFRTNFAGRSLNQAEKVIADYDSTAGQFRKTLLSRHNTQEGDPVKAAEFIIQHIDKPDATLRLPLGTVPIKTIGMKIDSLRFDLETNKEIAMKAVF